MFSNVLEDPFGRELLFALMLFGQEVFSQLKLILTTLDHTLLVRV
jgi:hypothetical protein